MISRKNACVLEEVKPIINKRKMGEREAGQEGQIQRVYALTEVVRTHLSTSVGIVEEELGS